MRFITEFEREVISIPNIDEFISNFPDVRKMRGEEKLGQMLSNAFGWKENAKIVDGKEMNRWSLEIEAFPTDKWIEFKQEILKVYGEKSHAIQELLKLESFGKP